MNKIAIHSVPRSGSSWLGEIINSSPEVNYAFQPLFSYEFKSKLSETSSLSDINDFFLGINETRDDFIRQSAERALGRKPKFIKHTTQNTIVYKEVRYHYIIENLLKTDSEIKVIALIRNPLSVISSWYDAPREFRKDLGWNIKEELMEANKKNLNRKEEYFGLNKWIEVTLLFEKLKKKYPDRFYIVKYEDLCLDTRQASHKIYDFLSLEFNKETIKFVENNKNISGTYSVIKKKKMSELNVFKFNKDIEDIIRNEVEKYSLQKYM